MPTAPRRLGDEIELGAVERVVGNAAGQDLDVVDQVVRSAICSAPPARSRRSSRSWRSATSVAPPTINLDNPSVETPIDLVPHKARKRDIDVVLSNSFGFGGTNASLVFRRAAA